MEDAMDWSAFSGKPLAEVLNALYLREVDQQLRLYFDEWLVEAPIETLLPPKAPPPLSAPDVNPERYPDTTTIREWFAALKSPHDRVLRVRSKARLALGPGFWSRLDGDSLRAELEERTVDPIYHYGLTGVAWDTVSRYLLAEAEVTFVELRENWLASAATCLIDALARNPQLQIEGREASTYARNEPPTRLAQHLFGDQPRSWRIYRKGSRLEVLKPDGSTLSEYRAVKLVQVDMVRSVDRKERTLTQVQPATTEQAPTLSPKYDSAAAYAIYIGKRSALKKRVISENNPRRIPTLNQDLAELKPLITGITERRMRALRAQFWGRLKPPRGPRGEKGRQI